MVTETGTATSYHDLLTKFKDFLVTDAGWTQLQFTAGVADTDTATLSIRAPGALSGHEFYLNIITEHNVGLGQYGWKMYAAASYDSDLTFSEQAGSSPHVYFNTWQDDIDYWFYANSRRVVVATKVNTSYVTMYAGLFLPFALPTEYLKPFFICGNYPELATHDVANARNRMIADPGKGCAYYLNINASEWLQVENHDTSAAETNFRRGSVAFVWPHRTAIVPASGASTGWNANGFLKLRPNLFGEMPNWRCLIFDLQNQMACGALEGIYAAAGFDRVSEQEITAGAKTLRLFQNIFRSTARDFLAIEEE